AALRLKSPVVVTVKARRPVPFTVVTGTSAVGGPIGAVVVIVVLVIERTTAATPLKATVVVPLSRSRSPVRVTNVPIVPLDGSIAVMLGPKTTVNVRLAVALSLPARS